MVPLIQSRQNVGVEPVDATKVEVGDMVLVRVAGTTYLHLSYDETARVRVGRNDPPVSARP